MSSISFPLSFHLVIFAGTEERRGQGPLNHYPLFTPYLPFLYPLFTPYLPFIYHLFTLYLHLIYPLFTLYLPLIYLLFTLYLPLIYPLCTPYLPLIYLLFTLYLPLIYHLLTLYLHLIYPLCSSYLPPIHPLFEYEPVHPCFIFHVQAAYWIFSGIPNENMRTTIRRPKKTSYSMCKGGVLKFQGFQFKDKKPIIFHVQGRWP